MKKVICLLGVLALCLTLAVPVLAAEDTFVPSISYKDGPDAEKAEQNGEVITDCLEITSIKEATEKTTDISQEERDLLLEVYEQLEKGDMKLPVADEDLVVRELVDVSYKKTACVDVPHGHKDWLAKEGNTISVTFDLGVSLGTKVVVMVYVNGSWVEAESVVNNGDRTVTVVFEDICPVAFCVEVDGESQSPQTGDAAGADLLLWAGVLVAALAGIVVMLIYRRRIVR